ncbi:MAG: histidine kinase dimerization/phosphoacceptor domain -containing protein [Verrucomicrobiota bacterium]
MSQLGKALNILLLEDDEADAVLLQRELEKTRLAFRLRRVSNQESFLAALEQPDLDIILGDLRLGAFDGLTALKLARQRVPTVPFVVVTGSTTEETAVECMKSGAADYVLKQHWVRLGAAIQSILKQREVRAMQEIAERALRASESRNRAVLDAALDCIVAMDAEGRIVEFNPAAERTFGRQRGDVIGEPMADLLVPPALRERHRRAFLHHLATGESTILNRRIEMTALRADGTEFPMEMAVTRIELHGTPLFIAYLRDISDRKESEQRLKASLQEKEVLLKEIHHRVKNNLQVISSLFNLETSFAKDQQVVSILRDHRDRVQSMALVHEQLYSSTDFAHVEFSDYLRRLAANLVRSFGANTIQARFEVEKVTLGVDTAIACGLIVNELISNALKHAFPNGRPGEIGVALHQNGGAAITLTVRDNGVGFPPGTDWQKSKSLGLQLVAILAEQLRATVGVTSGNGTCFDITLTETKTRP